MRRTKIISLLILCIYILTIFIVYNSSEPLYSDSVEYYRNIAIRLDILLFSLIGIPSFIYGFRRYSRYRSENDIKTAINYTYLLIPLSIGSPLTVITLILPPIMFFLLLKSMGIMIGIYYVNSRNYAEFPKNPDGCSASTTKNGRHLPAKYMLILIIQFVELIIMFYGLALGFSVVGGI